MTTTETLQEMSWDSIGAPTNADTAGSTVLLPRCIVAVSDSDGKAPYERFNQGLFLSLDSVS